MIAVDSLEALYADGEQASVHPLWVMMKDVVTPRPKPGAVPHLWSYESVRALLDRAAGLIRAEDAERRVFMLTNPGLQPPCATDTLFAGLQYILPGEIAPAHRHSAFALRFIVEGSGAYSAVGGEKVIMNRGDVVLTPSWMWHDHGNESAEPMIWLDGLPLPILQAIPVNFAQPYAHPTYPSLPAAADSNLHYPWAEMQARLDAANIPFVQLRYVQRVEGTPISRIIGGSAERLAPKTDAKLTRETASVIYHAVDGSGSTTINDETIVWKARDTFAVPAWATVTHHNTSSEPAYLFRFDDRPLLDALGLYRTEFTAPQ